MGLISFIKDAGEKLFGHKETPSAPVTAPAAAPAQDASALQAQAMDANHAAATAISNYIGTQKLKVDDLKVAFDGSSGTVTVSGKAADQATREKVVLCCGNVRGVNEVDDQLTVDKSTDESRYYTVVRGDTLSAISKTQYANANDYMKIFEANKPMLSDPDKIYPGQVLRIPA